MKAELQYHVSISKVLFPNSLCLIILLCLSTLVYPQTEYPDTPAGKRGKEIFGLFTGENTITPKEYVRQNCTEEFKSGIPEASWGGAVVQIKNMMGSCELASIEKSEQNNIVYTIRPKSGGMQFQIDITVEDKAPNKIAMMRFLPAGQSAKAPQQKQSSNATVGQAEIDKVKEYLKQKAEEGQFSGTALIAKDGKPILIESAGLASKRFNVPNNKDTKINLGSLNKSFTAAAILQLVEAGKIGIDDPINKYLDCFPEEIGSKVTVRQLLDMTNGWGDYWGNEYYLAHKDMLRTVADYMKFIKDIPLDFEPGSRMQHSNIGFEVAGAIIEKVTGMDYFDYIREKIYKPLGMNNSDNYDRDSPVENLATGYTNNLVVDKANEGWQWENTYILAPKGTPAGGGYSTVEDMLKYDQALRNGKIVGKAYADFMLNRYKGKIGDPYKQTSVSKSAGGAYGVSTFFARDILNGLTVIVLTNIDHPFGVDLGNDMLKIMGLE